jgi:hypothetical protein
MDHLEWLAAGLLLLLMAAFAGALFLYLRTAHRSVFLYPDGSLRRGGWKQVRKASFVAVVTIAAFVAIRVAENLGSGLLRLATQRWFK